MNRRGNGFLALALFCEGGVLEVCGCASSVRLKGANNPAWGNARRIEGAGFDLGAESRLLTFAPV